MTKTKKIITVVLSCVIFLATFLVGFLIGRGTIDEDVATFNYIITHYKKYYYEETDDIIGVIEDALLDKYSEYYTKEEYEIVKSTAKGEREGVGFSYDKTTNTITQVLGNSPAKRAGVKEGGVIVGVGLTADTIKTPSTELSLSDILSEIPANVDFVFRVDYGEEAKDYTVQKRKYLQTFVSYYDESGEYGFTGENDISFTKIGENTDYPLGDIKKTAVIKYTGFSGLGSGLKGSAGQFKKALEKFKDSGKTNLILDIRNNGGGYMSILSSVAAHLINAEKDSKKLVSYATYKDGKKDDFLSEAVDYSDYGFEKIIILANENSASASEALIGAVLDYDKDNIVNVILDASVLTGEVVYKTYGKGIMQSTYDNILTGEAIKLTTAKIYWPKSNKSIHGVGVTATLDERVLNAKGSNGFYDALKLLK